MFKVLSLFILSFFLNQSRADDCDGKDLGPNKYTIKTGLGKTYEEALNEALIGVERETIAASLVASDTTIIDSKEGTQYRKFIGRIKAIYIDNFITRSCRENGKVQVTAFFPKKGVSYFPLPPKWTNKTLASIDEGLGVTVYVWAGEQADITIVTAKKKLCERVGDHLVCAFPIRQNKYVVGKDNKVAFNVYRTITSHQGYFDSSWVDINEDPIEMTELLTLELMVRSNGSGMSNLRSINYDEIR